MINRDLLQQFDEDDLYVGYNPAMPMKIFGYELESSKCEIYISSKLQITEIALALSQYLDWLASCKAEATEYFCSKLGERLPEDWFETIEVYSAEITFTTLEDFGAVITFGESTLPDHVVEFTIDKFTIENDLLIDGMTSSGLELL